MSSSLDRLWPSPEADLGDEALVSALLGAGPVVRANFVSSVDGSATHNGLSGGLSNDADKRYFELLRRVSDVVLVGAGTVRTEGYGALRVSEKSVGWRVAHGMSEHPVFAIVSRSLEIDRAIVDEAPVRPMVFTIRGAVVPAWLERGADIVVTGDGDVEGERVVAALATRGLDTVLCEGGPQLFARLLNDDVIDELCLTVAPVLEGGDDGIRITSGLAANRSLTLVSILRSRDTMLLRYRRERS